jgi:hypothetical protein
LSRRLRIPLKSLALLIAAALVSGVVYEQVGRGRDRTRIQRIGRPVDIGGRTLNISCSGKGGPPVIFESGGPGPGLAWEPLQEEVAKFTRACWYDRAGEGWSDSGPFLWRPLCLAFQTAALVGLVRLTQPSSAQAKSPSEMTRDEIIAALRQQPKSFVGNISTGVVLPESYAEAKTVTTLGDRPIIVLTAGQPFDFRDQELNRQAEAYQQIWIHEIQPKLARLSTRGRQIVIPNSNHGTIPQDVVITAIRDVVTEVCREKANGI